VKESIGFDSSHVESIRKCVLGGNVKEDIDNDDDGDNNLAGVLIALLDADKDVLRTTLTDSSGDYKFVDVEPGLYFVKRPTWMSRMLRTRTKVPTST
jgi:hypothetical protein